MTHSIREMSLLSVLPLYSGCGTIRLIFISISSESGMVLCFLTSTTMEVVGLGLPRLQCQRLGRLFPLRFGTSACQICWRRVHLTMCRGCCGYSKIQTSVVTIQLRSQLRLCGLANLEQILIGAGDRPQRLAETAYDIKHTKRERYTAR